MKSRTGPQRKTLMAVAAGIIVTFVLVFTFLLAWLDVVFYVIVNLCLGSLWWKHKNAKTGSDAKLSLGQSTMTGTIQAGVTATSIFIPLSLAALQIGPRNSNLLNQAALSNVIIAIVWFGVSTILGLIAFSFVNQLIGEGKFVLRERRVGIIVNLQLYAIFCGVARLLFVAALAWGQIGNGVH